jgi:hypothetical protein
MTARPTPSVPLIDLSDNEVRERLRIASTQTVFGYGDLLAELDRRARWRQARASFALSVAIAVGAVLVAVLR